MATGFTIQRNELSAPIKNFVAQAKPGERRKILKAMGATFLSITQGNFNKAGAKYRPTPWAAKKDGKPATLKKTGALVQGLHLTSDDNTATVATTDLPYAAIHQFGGRTKAHKITAGPGKAIPYAGGFYRSVNHPGSNIPPRPYFPVINGKLTPAAEALILKAGERVIKKP